MYALSFDMEIAKLKEHYGESYNKAYDEIRLIMFQSGFIENYGNLYISKYEDNRYFYNNEITNVYKAITQLSRIKWFADSVKHVRAFKVEDWSDFTEIVKANGK